MSVTAFPPVDPGTVRPTVDDVAKLARTRTIDQDSGDDVAAFTPATRPTDSDVEDLIDQATDDELARLPAAIDPQFYASIRAVIAKRVAILVETSFFRVQLESSSVSTLARMLADDQAMVDYAARGVPRLY